MPFSRDPLVQVCLNQSTISIYVFMLNAFMSPNRKLVQILVLCIYYACIAYFWGHWSHLMNAFSKPGLCISSNMCACNLLCVPVALKGTNTVWHSWAISFPVPSAHQPLYLSPPSGFYSWEMMHCQGELVVHTELTGNLPLVSRLSHRPAETWPNLSSE